MGDVLVIADPLLPVPPRGYGGTERIAAQLCEGLLARHQNVTLLAGPGSRNYGTLIVHRAPDNRCWVSRAYRKLLFQVLSLRSLVGCRVVHSFGRLDYLVSILRTRVPLVVRFGNPISRRDVEWLLRQRRERMVLVSVSDNQRRHVSDIGNWRTVYNGVDVANVVPRFSRSEHGYLAYLGLVTREKGIDLAIEVARRTGGRLKIGGIVPSEPEAQAFFDHSIAPRLDEQIQLLGEVFEEMKGEFLRNAKALLMPIRLEESFGIVVAEALACGTPVVAMRRGSMPELIVDGRNGFLCDDVDGMCEAVERIGEIDRRVCRQDCEERFSAQRMTQDYLAIYDELCRS